MNFIQNLLAAANNQVEHAFHATFTEALALDAPTVLSWLRVDSESLGFEEEGFVYLYRVELPLFDVLDFEEQRAIAEKLALQFQELYGLYIPVYGDEENATLIAYLSSAALTDYECAEYFDDIEDSDDDEEEEPDPDAPDEKRPLVLVPTISADSESRTAAKKPHSDPTPPDPVKAPEGAQASAQGNAEPDVFEAETPTVFEAETPTEFEAESANSAEAQNEIEQDEALAVDPADAAEEKFSDEVQPPTVTVADPVPETVNEEKAESETDDSALANAIAEEEQETAKAQEEQRLIENAAKEAEAAREALYAEILEILPNDSATERQENGTLQVIMTAKNGEALNLFIEVKEQMFMTRKLTAIIMNVEGVSENVQVLRVAQLAEIINSL